jgi:hypothetical protein
MTSRAWPYVAITAVAAVAIVALALYRQPCCCCCGVAYVEPPARHLEPGGALDLGALPEIIREAIPDLALPHVEVLPPDRSLVPPGWEGPRPLPRPSVATVPEPSTLALLLPLAAVLWSIRHKD